MRQELPLHDAAFNGVMLGDKSAQLNFVGANGAPYVVNLLGIRALQMDDFREGNIVLILEVISGEEPPSEIAWNRLYPPPHEAAAQQYHQQHESFLRTKRSEITEGSLTLVQLIPSLGADLLAVCESLETVAD